MTTVQLPNNKSEKRRLQPSHRPCCCNKQTKAFLRFIFVVGPLVLWYKIQRSTLPTSSSFQSSRENRYQLSHNEGSKNTGGSWPPPHVRSKNNIKLSSSFVFQFPSVEERVKYYMGSWYDSTQNETLQSLFRNQPCPRYFSDRNFTKATRQALLFDRNNIQSPMTKGYGRDTLEYVFGGNVSATHNSHTNKVGGGDDRVVLERFGDTPVHVNLPLIQKARYAISSPTNWKVAKEVVGDLEDASEKYYDALGMSRVKDYLGFPIPPLGFLNVQRHFGPIQQVVEFENSSKNDGGNMSKDWQHKKSTLFWRGFWTGRHRLEIMTQFSNSTSNLIDVGFVENRKELEMNNHGLPFKPSATLQEQLQYKYLLSIEGNDVASGLKWMLYANAVVFMSPPTRTTWAMEEWLVPYYHYIPIMANGSDLMEKIQWAQTHDEECQTISKQSTEFMQNLYASEESKANNRIILKQMLARYQEQYGEWLWNCREKDPIYQQNGKQSASQQIQRH